MGPPPIHLFLTTIASQPALRQRQEFLLRTLEVKKIPFIPYDLASDEEAKKLWKRKVPLDKQQLPGILIGGRFAGVFSEFEEAVEFGELDIFLRRNEEYDEALDGPLRPMPAAQAVGVPGASTPHQMTPEHLKPRIYAPDASPLRGKTATGKDAIPINKRADQFDVSTELEGYGLQGVMSSEDELRQLVEELGLGGDEAGDLVKGLGALMGGGEEKKDSEKGKDGQQVQDAGKSAKDGAKPAEGDSKPAGKVKITPLGPIQLEGDLSKKLPSLDQQLKAAASQNDDEDGSTPPTSAPAPSVTSPPTDKATEEADSKVQSPETRSTADTSNSVPDVKPNQCDSPEKKQESSDVQV